jgi:8-amino-7-oxononanoate synthase
VSSSLQAFASEKLGRLERQSLRRALHVTQRLSGARVMRDGRALISFACNDYLNLANHPAVIAASVAATQRYGAGAGASRLVTGDHPLYAGLEARLAALKGTEDAAVFGSGYLANSGIIPALVGPGDVLFVDELAHACIWAGAKLSGAAVHVFRHNDMAALAALLADERARHRHAMVATDTVFSMDGDLAPIAELAELAAQHDVWALTDDAHGLGVVPKSPDASRIPLQVGTLSKAVGGYGGYLCASREVIALIRNRARSFVYTTGLPPGVVAGAIAALDVIAEDPKFAARPLANANRFTQALGLAPARSPIVPLIVGEAQTALVLSDALARQGFLVSAIRPPTVPEGTARLRFTFTAAHTPEDIDRLAACVRQLRPELKPQPG